MPYCGGIEVFQPYPPPPNYTWEFRGCLGAGNGLWRLVQTSGTTIPNPPPPPVGTLPSQPPSAPSPIANFSYRILAGGRVDFTNLSSNASSYQWDLGENRNPTTVNPSHTYSSGGNKTVTLTARNSAGGISTKQVVIPLTILPAQADFTVLKGGLKVFITDTSTIIGSVFSYDWGDGSAVSTEQNPTHTYAVAGDYLIRQVVNGTYVKEQTVSVVAGITILIQDSFTDTNGTLLENHTPEIGSAWTNHLTAPIKIDNNRATRSIGSGSGTGAVNNAQFSDFNCYAQAVIYGSAYGTTYNASLKINSTSNYSSQDILLISIKNGTLSINNNQVNHTFISGALYKIQRIDNTIYAYCNGVLVHSRPAVGTGHFSGFGFANNTLGTTLAFDDFEAGEGIPIPDANLPIASFSTDVSSGIAPLTVNCTDTSTGDPETWLYEVGGVEYTTQNCTFELGVGTWPVKLTIANDYGVSSYVKTITVIPRETFTTPDPIPDPPSDPQPSTVIGTTTYILDKLNDKVLLYDADEVYLGYFGGTGTADGQLQDPTWLCKEGNNILVVDSGNNRIQVFDSSGNFLSKFGDANFKGIASNGVYRYATDYDNNKVIVFDMNGVKVSEFGSTGGGRGQFKQPYGIATDNNYIYVVDSLKLQAFTFGYEFVAEAGRAEVNGPTDLWLDAINIYINNLGNDEVLVYSRAFNFPTSVNQTTTMALTNNIMGA